MALIHLVGYAWVWALRFSEWPSFLIAQGGVWHPVKVASNLIEYGIIVWKFVGLIGLRALLLRMDARLRWLAQWLRGLSFIKARTFSFYYHDRSFDIAIW
ncbi:hypothetical protein CFIMG_007284RA00001 [Ceratocystis fimbriata CBS 114723]|uniref:Uncharacterized protein n=1 Tax=Ceratocystis fimbriata CBS 114723 TaxID=1035309 RepID=A0A2C5XI18_9PEZI|nr:hypothetical protein CFIMG_007284RA00001 [Ceratocystis fimbriata CBS 114723]